MVTWASAQQCSLALSWQRGGPFTGPGGAIIEEIGRVLVKGIEPLKNLAQAALDLVLKAANKKLDETEGSGDTGSVKLGPGGAAEKVFDYFVKRGLSEEIAAGFVGTFQKESGLRHVLSLMLLVAVRKVWRSGSLAV